MKRLIWFLFAGGCGFLIDAGLTEGLILLGMSPFAARIPAISAAMAFTFFINRTFTFGRSGHSLVAEGVRYWAVGMTSALLNYCVYSLLIHRLPLLQPVVAVALGSFAATAYSYFGYSRFVFRHRRGDAKRR
ncbi:GtrA family protein [Rhizobium sp. SSA_523]|uniref:GtrA family protein n=1 Tax=Rhizobium sp. SSA_523 TaxID=2952477 RepID=UPI0020909BFA|nr:GtrA family protein [Rhizobium sp. SSA_523]MCO5732740.1 GtrA family protein [Rhizobium sp. SSA_523]WKC25792.1 GtrA family protein [Rhizobium sp. SSA_523]